MRIKIVDDSVRMDMPYIFALLVAANAVFMGYHLLKTKEPQTVAQIHIEQKDQFPETLEVVTDAR